VRADRLQAQLRAGMASGTHWLTAYATMTFARQSGRLRSMGRMYSLEATSIVPVTGQQLGSHDGTDPRGTALVVDSAATSESTIMLMMCMRSRATTENCWSVAISTSRI